MPCGCWASIWTLLVTAGPLPCETTLSDNTLRPSFLLILMLNPSFLPLLAIHLLWFGLSALENCASIWREKRPLPSRDIFHNSLLSLVSTHPALNFQGGSADRGLATMMGNLSLVPKTYMMGRKNWPLQVVLWPTHMYFCANTPHQYIYIYIPEWNIIVRMSFSN